MPLVLLGYNDLLMTGLPTKIRNVKVHEGQNIILSLLWLQSLQIKKELLGKMGVLPGAMRHLLVCACNLNQDVGKLLASADSFS